MNDALCVACGAIVKQYAEGFRDYCWDCANDGADSAETDNSEEPESGSDHQFMGKCGLQQDYWL